MNDLIFTRYLYPKMDVMQSLLLAMLDGYHNEALFWAYELYYSGFEEETYRYLYSIYESYYRDENPELESGLFAMEACDITSDPCHIGTIVSTMTSRNYQVSTFLSMYKSIKIPFLVHEPRKFRFVITLKEKDIVDYQTVLPEPEKSRHYLKRVCKYPIRRQYNRFFESCEEDYKKELWYHWLYYACRSPIWLSRVEEFGGSVNDESKTIDFTHDEDCEDLSELFYQIWGLEPDEQSKELQEKCIGPETSSIKQVSIDEFSEKYGGIKRTLQNTFVIRYN